MLLDDDESIDYNLKNHSQSAFSVSDGSVFTRTISLTASTRLQLFRNEIQRRDGRCVITDKIAVNAHHDIIFTLSTTHPDKSSDTLDPLRDFVSRW